MLKTAQNAANPSCSTQTNTGEGKQETMATASDIKVGDRVEITEPLTGKVSFHNRYDNYLEIKLDGGRILSGLRDSQVKRVIPPEPGVGAIVEVDGVRWLNAGGYSKWSKLGTEKSVSLDVPFVSYKASGREWSEVYRPGFIVLAGAL